MRLDVAARRSGGRVIGGSEARDIGSSDLYRVLGWRAEPEVLGDFAYMMESGPNETMAGKPRERALEWYHSISEPFDGDGETHLGKNHPKISSFSTITHD